jgi:hypothetical protein
VPQLAELLDSGEYESSEDLAKAVYDKSVEIFLAHDLWGLAAGSDAYGPFTGKVKATSAAKFFGLDPERTVKPLLSHTRLVYSDTEIPDDRYCPECQHPCFAHFPKKRKDQTAHGCLVMVNKVQCPCQLQFKERKV